MVAVTGAIEITVHGWDISVACGARRPVPPGLATILLPIAPLLITPGTRPGLFADPVRLVRPTVIELRGETGQTRIGVLNSVPLTLFAVLLALENWLLWLAAELTVRFGALATVTTGADGVTARHVPTLTAEMTVYYAWDTVVLLLLWGWCGWRLVVGGDFGEPADGEGSALRRE